MSLWNGMKRGTKALFEGKEPASFTAGGKKVYCPHCDSDRFHAGRAVLNTLGMTLLNLDWVNREEATTLTCGRCTMIQWFRAAPEQVAGSANAKDVHYEL